jgi:hypothetical protein
MKRWIVLFFAATILAAGKDPILPDHQLTPGATVDIPLKTLCTPGYTAQPGVRHVTDSTKRKVFAEYGLDPDKIDTSKYEIDHLISLELGGSNDIKNLWPQSYVTKPYNAHVKDVLENRLHHLVCSGKLDLRTAQKEISSDWISAYRKYVTSDK